ncbi:MAG TPA: hypothetical protein DFS52_04260 [Myxococcales bacterium]|mgnify:CR=1 FL=1|jgi:hypothetical protein|nr:hypothetical protein [Myxococcales bacterium]
MVAIGRMLRRLDAGARKGLKRALDTPRSEDVIYATDRWLTALESQEKRARELVRQARSILGTAHGRPGTGKGR